MDAYLGEIRIFCGAFAPKGWVFCDGQLLDIAAHRQLFSLLGTAYGGDGVGTFAVPDLRGRVALHEGTNESSGSTYPLGARGGVEEVALNGEQLPRHTHHVFAHRGSGNTCSPSGALHAGSALTGAAASGPAAAAGAAAETAPHPPAAIHAAPKLYSSSAPSGRLHPHAVRPSGGSQPHDNMMPFLTVNFILSIAADDTAH